MKINYLKTGIISFFLKKYSIDVSYGITHINKWYYLKTGNHKYLHFNKLVFAIHKK